MRCLRLHESPRLRLGHSNQVRTRRVRTLRQGRAAAGGSLEWEHDSKSWLMQITGLSCAAAGASSHSHCSFRSRRLRCRAEGPSSLGALSAVELLPARIHCGAEPWRHALPRRHSPSCRGRGVPWWRGRTGGGPLRPPRLRPRGRDELSRSLLRPDGRRDLSSARPPPWRACREELRCAADALEVCPFGHLARRVKMACCAPASSAGGERATRLGLGPTKGSC